jgi:hypothetical protein
MTHVDGPCIDTESIMRGLTATATYEMTYRGKDEDPQPQIRPGMFHPQEVSNYFGQEIITTTRPISYRHLFHCYPLKMVASREVI